MLKNALCDRSAVSVNVGSSAVPMESVPTDQPSASVAHAFRFLTKTPDTLRLLFGSPGIRSKTFVRAMKLTAIFLLVAGLTASATGVSQSISMSGREITLNKVFTTIEKQTGYVVFYNKGLLRNTHPVSLNVSGMPLTEFLETVLKNQELGFTIDNKTILIVRKRADILPAKPLPPESVVELPVLTIEGQVIGTDGAPVANATVSVKNASSKAVSANGEGFFTLSDVADNVVLIISAVGFQKMEVGFRNGEAHKLSGTGEVGKKGNKVIFRLELSDVKMDDVVVTGIYTRKKESFTGSSATYSAKDLKLIGNQNVIQSLKTLDPSVLVLDNKNWGSDPNRLPDMEIRGKTSIVGLKDEYGTDPNQPLFILDGFETSLQTIMDLSIERVESITILKDAASTAIYGSRAANGVIVVETKKPEAGKLKLNYGGNFTVQMPDLSGYNLMNSEEKLRFEQLAGYYTSDIPTTKMALEKKYNDRLADIRRGVNTYWMSEPLRTAFNSRHNLYAEGGDNAMRYGIGFNYGQTKGVMKGSDRDIISGNIDLSYRKSKFRFSNKTMFDYTNADREPVSFSDYSQANPYYRKTDESGKNTQILDINGTRAVANPNYTAGLQYLNNNNSLTLVNNFQTEWDVKQGIRLRARLGINYGNSNADSYKSPKHPDFINTTQLERGRYTQNKTKNFSYDGDVALTYGRLFGEKHQVNLVGGWNFNDRKSENSGYSVIGFINDNYINPAFGTGFQEGSKPSYSKIRSKATSFYLNGNYSYDNRYLMDINFRSDGSSVFGVNNKFSNTWSTGLAWNIHNEAFMEEHSWITMLKLRGSVGNPGNQNFDAYQAMKTYTYNSWLQNMFGVSAIINAFGNKDLKWQKTVNKTIGLDVVVLNNRLRLNVDYYTKSTDPLLVFIGVPTSLGTNQITTNLGSQFNKGYDGSISYSPVYRLKQGIIWTVNMSFRHDKSEFQDMGNALSKLNAEGKESKSLQRYYDGGSPDDLWAVRSLGIDPATGRELFLKKNGSASFGFDSDDEVIVGNSRPDLEGIIGSSLRYKGVSVSASFRYRLGAQVFASALYNKVENISADNLFNNQDKRALYDRWQKPGDQAKYKGISITEATQMSSRFVLDENTFAGESISIGYEPKIERMKFLGASAISFRAYMNDIFRIASFREERGTDYPFARSVSFSVNLRF